MIKREAHLLAWITGALLVLILAGCGTTPATPSLPSGADPGPTATGIVILPYPSPSPPEGSGSAEAAPPTPDPAIYGLPSELTANEVAAARAGEAVYSGYSCVVTPQGCACEIPVIERSTFTFAPEGHMLFHFTGDGYASEWEMSRLGPDQWSYTIPMFSQSGDFQGAFFVLLTFTPDGYVYNLGADFDEGGIVTCPDVTFRRLSTAGQPDAP